MKFLLLTLSIVAYCSAIKAEDCKGYIINSKGDSVSGIVDVAVYKRALNTKKEIMFADAWDMIKFGEGTNKPKKMKVGEILGYGFEYLGQWYHFEVLDLQKNSGRKAPKLLAKMINDFKFFILRSEDGPLPVYKEYWKTENTLKENNPTSFVKQEKITGYDINLTLYVKNPENIYIEIGPTTLGGQKKLKNFLRDYLKLENDFLNTIDDKTSFSDAEEILTKYNQWKKAKMN